MVLETSKMGKPLKLPKAPKSRKGHVEAVTDSFQQLHTTPLPPSYGYTCRDHQAMD